MLAALGHGPLAGGKRHCAGSADSQQSACSCDATTRRRKGAEADPNEIDAQGETPLMKAASRGDTSMAFLLLEARADPLVQSDDGRTARDCAQEGTPVSTLLKALTKSAELIARHAELVEAAQEVLPNDLRKRCQELSEECAAKAKAERLQCQYQDLLGIDSDEDDGDSDDCGNAPRRATVALEDYIPADMDNVLEDLLFRDITPEDYDMLLQLDEELTPATASHSSLAALDDLEESDPEEHVGQQCVICQTSFDVESDEHIIVLHCGHPFHRDCIRKWLTERSEVCPLCGDRAFCC
mmetsp:Transcript_29438/g.67800  ORF Transcript_29438/g.67800 Transcript_29438/m.67800 type:complete len:297 (+) Transcript_29438:119-1009(+)